MKQISLAICVAFAGMFASSSTALAKTCYGGETGKYVTETHYEDKFVTVEIVDNETGFKVDICFTTDVWAEESTSETIARFIVALSEGQWEIGDLYDDLSGGLSVSPGGRKHKFERVTVYTRIANIQRGTTY